MFWALTKLSKGGENATPLNLRSDSVVRLQSCTRRIERHFEIKIYNFWFLVTRIKRNIRQQQTTCENGSDEGYKLQQLHI